MVQDLGSELHPWVPFSLESLVALDSCSRGFLPCSHGHPGWRRLGGVRRVAPSRPLPLRSGHCMSAQKQSGDAYFQEDSIQAQGGSI